ncbi:hypothetical protein DPMN_148531 [Dreissena polymorpha]|uniref:Uncharacterized protein n=1 Tax=Dreissena polymorpha TaxID=45954 RepID=A0A9D4J432_DREPO|nr:hypothetical protein DPMN_148531 [Dreissena polymorpha]
MWRLSGRERFHEDKTINVTSRLKQDVFVKHNLAQTNQPTNQQTNQQTNRQGKNNMSPTTIVGDIKSPTPWWPYIIGTNFLTKFHEDRNINVAYRVLTRQTLTLHN